MDSNPLEKIKPNVRQAPAYSLRARTAPIKLNQNENPYDYPEELKARVLERMAALQWSRYPELTPLSLHRKLARFAGWQPDGLLTGNGSNELLQAAFAAVLEPGKKVLLAVPTFSLYRLIAQVLGASVIEVPLAKDFSYDLDAIAAAIDAERPELIVLCSPNNPTGSILSPAEVEEVCRRASGLVIVDEAYVEFAGSSACLVLARQPNLIIARTFSKAFGMAGLRLGYLLARPEIIVEITKAKVPFSVNIFSQVAAETALDESDLMRERIEAIIAARDELYRGLSQIAGVRAYPSGANFILFETARPAGQLFEALLERGILVRELSGYPMLGRALRVSVGRPEENRAFLAALREIMAEPWL